LPLESRQARCRFGGLTLAAERGNLLQPFFRRQWWFLLPPYLFLFLSFRTDGFFRKT
jgi:hypothetical protein